MLTANFQRDIELRPLVGHKEDGTEVTHAIDQIFLNGVRIGYAGHKPADPLNFIRRGVLSDRETLAEIQRLVQTKFGGASRKVFGVPELTDEDALDRDEGFAAHDDRVES